MSDNVIRTGVPCSQPCPPLPNDGWEWLAMKVRGEWRFLRCKKKQVGTDGI